MQIWARRCGSILAVIDTPDRLLSFNGFYL
jgi:hypothetical protein